MPLHVSGVFVAGGYCFYCWQIQSEVDATFPAVVINMKTSSASAVTHANTSKTETHSGVQDAHRWF